MGKASSDIERRRQAALAAMAATTAACDGVACDDIGDVVAALWRAAAGIVLLICWDAITYNLCQSIYARSYIVGRRRSVGRRRCAAFVRLVDGVNACKG